MLKFTRSCSMIFLGAVAFLPVHPAPRTAVPERGATMTVTALDKKMAALPAVSQEDVRFFVNKERTQIANWRPGEKLYLAVLIDDSLDSDVASQWRDLQEFFNTEPPTTYISVSYARDGTAM